MTYKIYGWMIIFGLRSPADSHILILTTPTPTEEGDFK